MTTQPQNSTKFGRLYAEDPRDRNYKAVEVLSGVMPPIKNKEWWQEGWFGNQGNSPHCVAFSWMHWLEDGPVIQDLMENRNKPLLNTTQFYNKCQVYDEWPGTNYDGTSVRAGAKVLKKLGIIKEYRWAFEIEDVIDCLRFLGPMVVGTNWYSNMTQPNRQNFLKPSGRGEGGHAYILNGVDTNSEKFRVKNSWGPSWGDNGTAYIRFKDFEKLLKAQGEACIAFQNKMSNIPDINSV